MGNSRTSVLDARGVSWASSKARAEKRLSQRPGVLDVSVNPVAQTASITYDADVTSIRELTDWIRDCGLHCAGRSVPDHVCNPLTDDDEHAGHTPNPPAPTRDSHDAHRGHDSGRQVHGASPPSAPLEAISLWNRALPGGRWTRR